MKGAIEGTKEKRNKIIMMFEYKQGHVNKTMEDENFTPKKLIFRPIKG